MEGMSERQYAAHVGLSRGAIQKAKTAERLVLFLDGSIGAYASGLHRGRTTDPSLRNGRTVAGPPPSRASQTTRSPGSTTCSPGTGTGSGQTGRLPESVRAD